MRGQSMEDRYTVTRTVTLKKGEGRSLKAGGPWVYDNEIASVVGGGRSGALAAVRDFDGYPMGIGVYNENSTIRVNSVAGYGAQLSIQSYAEGVADAYGVAHVGRYQQALLLKPFAVHLQGALVVEERHVDAQSDDR